MTLPRYSRLIEDSYWAIDSENRNRLRIEVIAEPDRVVKFVNCNQVQARVLRRVILRSNASGWVKVFGKAEHSSRAFQI